ncbi:cuticle protein-like [Macrobrachium nipponense]|uniref:cuticle protein-like n=1 Tax=Macrobrachium nipponense TaxID=159736 RepID=UPI0030C89436
MNSKVLLFLGVVALAAADKRPVYSYSPTSGMFADNVLYFPFLYIFEALSYHLVMTRISYEYSQESEESAEAKYDFNWAVKDEYSGNDFGHQESRDGDNTQGSYYVQLPDGRLQTVRYYVNGDSGYVAEVSYQGEARYPDSAESREYSAPRPTYSAPTPTYSAPRPTYSVPDSVEESQEYEQPRPVYG